MCAFSFFFQAHNWWYFGNKWKRGTGWKPGNLTRSGRGFVVDVLADPPRDAHLLALPRAKGDRKRWLPLAPGSKRSDWNDLIPCYAKNRCRC